MSKNEVKHTEGSKPADQAQTTALSGEVLNPQPPIPPKSARQHKATFASDNLKGGYMVRVEGPNSGAFAKREVPVERFDGTETTIKLDKLVWTGVDKITGKPVTLYKFIAHPRAEKADAISF